ncbi:hypothetical protein OEZ85_012892 [Tetradesmus obliquus]|uniref:LOV domain-containing protein n=1 Tax=Tetradesmus obliquus TaxID=3088 RepID=A0ABY8U6B4_TETOB|nr:hypothetical protein OEZ85_012892 [Tetradesmus obliquus]
MPIVFASSKFYEMTGYSPDEVLNNNCRFLQGPETERRKVMEIRDAIREDRCCQVCLLNYRKDGSKFLNQFFLSPIKDDQGIVTHYVGIQTDVSKAADMLQTPGALQEQQAAVAFGQAAGCRMCDVLMQQQDVAAQLHQQQQQQQAATQQPQEQQQPAGGAAAAPPQQQQVLSEDEDVVQLEVQHACAIHDAVQQCHPHAQCVLPSSLLQPLMRIQQAFVLADPRLPDCPIIHASPQFLRLTEYSREEVVGRNCRFLQGPATNPEHVQQLRTALTADPPQAVTVTLLNYSKSGRPFWNALHVAPMRDAEGKLEYFIGIQLDVSEAALQEENGPAAADGMPAAPGKVHLSTRMAHYSVTGAVRVACRGLSGQAGGLRRSMDCAGLPRRGYSRSLSIDGGSAAAAAAGGGGSVDGGSRRTSSGSGLLPVVGTSGAGATELPGRRQHSAPGVNGVGAV